MKKKLLIFLTCLCSFTFSGQTEKEKDLTDAFELIDTWLEAQYHFDDLPGISVGIVKDQELIWSKGYGLSDMEKGISATSNTIYSICSISKLFTSIAIMQLYEDGKLRLDDSISTHLPYYDLQQQFEESGPITIRSILTHSSGLPRESDFPYWSGPDFAFPSQEEIRSKLGEQETLYTASTYFQYSNLGLSLLGEVVEEVSGVPYDTYVEENILQPLRLADTHPYLPADQWGEQMATGYSSVNRDGTREKMPLFDAEGIKAAAGFSSTIEDLARFASWQFRVLENGGEEILRSSTLKEMQRVHWVDPDWSTHWGLGFSIQQRNGSKLVGHGGSCPGYRTTILMEPEKKLAYIVMINAMESPNRYADPIRDIILKAQRQEETEENGVNLDPYTGIYDGQPWNAELNVFSWFGKLAMVGFPSGSPGNRMTLLKHIEGDTFRRIRSDDSLGEEISFERGHNGEVIKLWRNSNFSNKLE